tara:strand:- start:210 stop:368 length:159 start_codon:yes stop_codon:yes gene_type:complete
MPKPGFKSVTLREDVYYHYADLYDKNRKELNLKGIESLSAYITYLLEKKDKT